MSESEEPRTSSSTDCETSVPIYTAADVADLRSEITRLQKERDEARARLRAIEDWRDAIIGNKDARVADLESKLAALARFHEAVGECQNCLCDVHTNAWAELLATNEGTQP